VKPAQNTRTLQTATGIFAALRGLLLVNRTGALKRSVRALTFSAFVATLGALVLASAPALAGEQYLPGPGTTFGSEGSGDGQFIEPAGVAVNDTTKDVYVVDKGNNRVEYFSSVGVYAGQFNGTATPAKSFSEPEAIAVDDSGKSVVEDPSVGDVYVGDPAHNVIDKFSATGKYEGQLTEAPCTPEGCTGEEAFTELHGVAVDPAGNVWVYQGASSYVDEFSDTGSFVKSFTTGAGVTPGLAADSSGGVYAIDGNEEVLKFNSATGTRLAEFDTGVKALALDPATNDLLVDQGNDIQLFAPVEEEKKLAEEKPSPLETFAQEGLSESHGIAASDTGAAYASERGANQVEFFNEVLLPDVHTGSASPVTETSETLHGTVNPEGKAIADCRFEYSIYGTEAGTYPNSVACHQTPAEIGVGIAAVSVSAEISGLQPGSTYHFRLTASNANGPSHGGDATFIATRPPVVSPLSLPDNRAYELVSTIDDLEVFPPEAGQIFSEDAELFGELIANIGGFRAAANGEAVAYVGGMPPSGKAGFGTGNNYKGNLYMSARSAAGWEASNIEPTTKRRIIEGFSADLSQQFFNVGEPKFDEQHGGTANCTGEAGEIYSRTGGIGTPTYRALVPVTSASENECGHLTFAGTSANDAHLLLQSPGAYTPQAATGEEGSPERGETNVILGGADAEGYDNLYDSVASALHQINVLPNGEPEPMPEAVFGGRTLIGKRRYFEHNFASAVSNDGSRIFWTDLNTGDLYVRENDTQPQSKVEGERCTESTKACTVQLDRAQPGATGTSGGGIFAAASSDGSKVFFTDCSRLTEGSTAVSENGCVREEERNGNEIGVPTGNDLYEYDLDSGRLADLTVDGNITDSLGADVQGVIGASTDGAYVYFVASGVLAGADAEGNTPTPGQPNLYMSHAGKATFIAALANEDNEFVGTDQSVLLPGTTGGDWRAEPGLRTAAVAPDGDAITFMSQRPLTGYDNHGFATFDQPEVFVYEADSGRLVCASCTPTGVPPAATAEAWEKAVGGHLGLSGSSTFMSRSINTEGTQVYFDTSQPLVSRDTNDRQDVYEWESDGSGGCEQARGCVRLLSGGDGPYDAYFLDASESGSDVFFTSREQLLPQALDGTVKLYDARLGGGFPESSLACTGTGCQGVPPAPPVFATPASVTFSGTDNFPPSTTTKKTTVKKTIKCKKGFVKNKKNKCVANKKKQKRAKKAGHGGRTKS
jgi:hypothetical protein